MANMLPKEFEVVHDDNADAFVEYVEDVKHGRGLVPRNFAAIPTGHFAFAPPFDRFIDEAQWPDLFAQQQEIKSSLFDVRTDNYDVLKSLDQNGYGLCWAFSSTKAMMYTRARMNEPGIRLAAYWVAGKVKGWADQGGWGGESMTEIASAGVPEEKFCATYSRRNDTPEAAANAALHKMTRWLDGTDSRETNRKIMVSAFLLGMAPVLDYDWLSHSMCGCRLVSLDPLTIDTDNSWGESAGTDRGCMRLQGSKAIPDSVVVPFVATAAP